MLHGLACLLGRYAPSPTKLSIFFHHLVKDKKEEYMFFSRGSKGAKTISNEKLAVSSFKIL